MAKEIIKIRQLTPDFYQEHQLTQMLDKDKDKGRGYGVLLAEVRGYKFAIPFRSNMKPDHEFCFDTIGSDSYKQGLDYSKAVIITDDRFISTRPFFLRDKSEFVTVRKNARTIAQKFEEFVERYIQAVKDQDQEFLNLRDIRFSTLQNYHKELCS